MSSTPAPPAPHLGRVALTLVLALPAGLAAPAAAQAPPQDGTQDRQQPPPEPIERLAEWPEVPHGEQGEIDKDIARIRLASTEEMGEIGRTNLIARGACVAPILIQKLGKERKDDARERIVAVLVAVTGAPHTRLLATSFDDRAEPVRIFALRRAAAFPDPGIREAAEAAWKRVSTAAKDEKASEDELSAAALALTSSGSLEALPRICADAEADWRSAREAILAAAAGARGPEATLAVRKILDGASDARVVAGLRVLTACGDRDGAPKLVAPYLDAENVQVRVAAINALRGIVDGDPPLERLSAFDAIEKAKRWKARL